MSRINKIKLVGGSADQRTVAVDLSECHRLEFLEVPVCESLTMSQMCVPYLTKFYEVPVIYPPRFKVDIYRIYDNIAVYAGRRFR